MDFNNLRLINLRLHGGISSFLLILGVYPSFLWNQSYKVTFINLSEESTFEYFGLD